VTAYLTQRLGPAVATGHEGDWQFFRIPSADAPRDPSTWDPELARFFHAPQIAADKITVAPRGSRLDLAWWWTVQPSAAFTLTGLQPDQPVTHVAGDLRSSPCGERDVTLTLSTPEETKTQVVRALPKTSTSFDLALSEPAPKATLTASASGDPCPVDNFPFPQYAQVIDLSTQ
jgi:hypothetical protein